MTATQTIDDMQLLGPKELGELLGRSTKSIRVDATRRPHTLPPRFIVPGLRKLQWRRFDVRRWMDALAAVEEAKRVAAQTLAKKTGSTAPIPVKGFALGNVDLGAAATEMLKRQEAVGA